MSDRIKGLVVTFKDDLREEQSTAIENAILLFGQVLEVRPLVVDPQTYVDRARNAHNMLAKINELILEDIA